MSPREEIEALAELCLKHDLYVLSDEAYWDIRYAGDSLSIASLPGMAERTVILYTFSKKFAMTGWRLGGAIGPKDVIDVIATLNVNEECCTNHFVQYAGVEALTGDQSGAERDPAPSCRSGATSPCELLNSIAGVTCYSPDGHLLPLPRRHRGDGARRADRLRRVPLGRPREDGLFLLHAAALRPRPARRDAAATCASPTRASTPTSIREGLGLLKALVES